MPFESQWSRIPLGLRWGICLVLGAAIVVALVRFVSHNNGNAQARVNAANLRHENHQAQAIVGADQAPRTVRLTAGASPRATLTRAVRRDMAHRIAIGNASAPLQKVACGRSGRRGGRIAYHCIAEAADVNYPFLAVLTPRAHRGAFCKRDFPPVPSENIPVSARCRL